LKKDRPYEDHGLYEESQRLIEPLGNDGHPIADDAITYYVLLPDIIKIPNCHNLREFVETYVDFDSFLDRHR
jgi:hypothetical protein